MAGIINNGKVYASKVSIDDTVISKGKTWSSEKISNINIKDAKKVDSKPTCTSNGDGTYTITYIKDGVTSTTTDDNQWFYYLVDDVLYQTIFIEGDEMTIQGSGADFDEYVKKTDITTTINSSSTDTQVPSAKAVYDNVQYKYLPTLHNVDVLDYIVNNINKEGFYTFYVADDCTNTPRGHWTRMFVDYLSPTRIIVTGVDIRSANNTYEYKNTMINTWSGWQRVCTTSVSDVDETYITSYLNETYVKPTNTNTNSYSVKNGICEIRIEANCIASTNTLTKIVSGLPKSKNVHYANAINRNQTLNINTSCLFMIAGSDLYVVCNYGDTSVSGSRGFYASLTYTVAES